MKAREEKLSQGREDLSWNVIDLQRRLQTAIGDRIFDNLRVSASTNREHKSLEPMSIWNIPYNGGIYSIIAEIPSDLDYHKKIGASVPLGGCYPVMQVDVDLSKKDSELHVHIGAYGPDSRYPLLSINSFIKEQTEFIRDFKLRRLEWN